MRIVTFKSVIVKLWIKAMLAKSWKILREKPLQSGGFTVFSVGKPIGQRNLATRRDPPSRGAVRTLAASASGPRR